MRVFVIEYDFEDFTGNMSHGIDTYYNGQREEFIEDCSRRVKSPFTHNVKFYSAELKEVDLDSVRKLNTKGISIWKPDWITYERNGMYYYFIVLLSTKNIRIEFKDMSDNNIPMGYIIINDTTLRLENDKPVNLKYYLK